VRAFFASILSFFFTPPGLLVMGILDSSVVFFMPMGLDVVLILAVARNPDVAWLYPLVAVTGGVVGCGITFWIGRKLGTHGLTRLVDARTLERVQRRVEHSAAPSVAALAIIPPPFPFTPFVLAAGAFGLEPWRFFGTLVVAKLLRYGTESVLAVRFGSGITTWMESTTFKVAVGIFILVVIAGTVVSGIQIARKAKEGSGGK